MKRTRSIICGDDCPETHETSSCILPPCRQLNEIFFSFLNFIQPPGPDGHTGQAARATQSQAQMEHERDRVFATAPKLDRYGAQSTKLRSTIAPNYSAI